MIAGYGNGLGEEKIFPVCFAGVDVSSHAKYVLNVCFIFGRFGVLGFALYHIYLVSMNGRRRGDKCSTCDE